MQINQRAFGSAAVLDLAGEIDLGNAAELRRALRRLLEEQQLRIVINMENVDFIDSTGIGIFLSVLKSLRDRGGDLKLSTLAAPVLKVFQLTRLDAFFDLHADVEAAEKAFAQTNQ